VSLLFHWRSIVKITQIIFFFCLFIGLIYFFARILTFLFIVRDEFILLWNTSQLDQVILQESNLEGLLLGNFILLLFFAGYLYYMVSQAIISRFIIHIKHSNKVADPFPVKSTIFIGLLLSIQWVIVLDLLKVLDQLNLLVFGYNVNVIDYISTAMLIFDPIPIQQIIIVNALFSLITVGLIYNNSVLGTYIKERTLFRINFDYITSEYIRETVNEEDIVLRNLRITQGYRDLSIGMSLLLGNQNTNWATYASWASKTAGRSIRKEEIPRILKTLIVKRLALKDFFDPKKVNPEPNQKLDDSDIMWNMYILGVIEDISKSIADGNLKVFEELAPIFSSFIFTFRDHKTPDQKELLRFLRQFKQGTTEEGGQDRIKEAFSRYYYSMFEKDRKKKAEMILLSNIQIGWHEQVRLQNAIEKAVTAPLNHGYEIVLADKLTGYTPIFRNRFKRMIQKRLSENKENYQAFVKGMVTSIMILETHEKKLLLSENVPKFSRFNAFPPDLRKIDDQKLVDAINTFDYDINSLKESRAKDWSNLEDRLGYIIDLFRTTQQTKKMFYPTFTKKQSKLIHKSIIPTGKL
jgi:hypothetical protein